MFSIGEFAPAARQASVTSTAITVITFLFLAMKIGARTNVQGRLGWDDGLAIIAFVVTVPLTVCIWRQSQYGMGKVTATLPEGMFMQQSIWFWASIWLYVSGIGLAKLSILTQYLRIFVGRRTKLVTWAMIAIVVAYTIQGDLVGIFTCTPVRKFWNRPLPGTCINIAAYYYITIAMNILTDIAIIVIPIPALIKLNVPTNQKYGLIFAFGLGGFGCIMSIVRLHAIAVSLNSPDPGEANATPAMWSVVEVHVCLICACLPSLRPVLLRIFPYASSFGSSNGQSAKRSQHHLTTTRKWTPGNGINRLSSNGGSVRIDDSERGLTEEVELEDVKSLNGGIQVISTSEVYSTRAPSGPTSRSPSSNSQVDLARPGGGDASWGYTVGVEAHHG